MPSIVQPAQTQPSNRDRHVAVYGTLRRGERNDINRLHPLPVFVGTTQLLGRLYDMGTYPGLVLDASGERVVCEVYAVSDAVEAAMDEIEATYPAQSDEYAKRERVLTVDTGQCLVDLPCFFYEVNISYVAGRALIVGGDWVRFNAE